MKATEFRKLIREEIRKVLKENDTESENKIQQYIRSGRANGHGHLDLGNTETTSLPNNLRVRGNLYLHNTPIKSLPNGLSVGGFLNIDDTPIESLPNDLKVGGNLYLVNTPLSEMYDEYEIRKMVPGVEGKIDTGFWKG